MKIKDFDEKVRIGSTVIYKSQAVRVEDILRSEHTAKLNREGWVRCSEFELSLPGVKAVRKRDVPVNIKPVIVIFPDGSRARFESATQAALQLGICVATVTACCRAGHSTRKGYTMKYESKE